MGEWARFRDFYIDINSAGGTATLLDGVSSSPKGDAEEFVQGDVFACRLFFRLPNTDTSVDAGEVTLPAGSTIVVAAKKVGGLGASSTLFSCTSFVETDGGADEDDYYLGTVDLSGANLQAALDSEESIAVKVDIEVRNAANTERLSFQFDATILKQAYKGDEGADTDGDPAYPSPERLVLKDCGTQAITNGQDYVTVTGLALDYTPAQVLVSVRKPAGGQNIFATIRDASISDDGFIADLSAAAPAAGYKLDYLCIEAEA